MSTQPVLPLEEGHVTEMTVSQLLMTYQVGGSGPWAAHHCSDCRAFDAASGKCLLYALATVATFTCPDHREPAHRPLIVPRWKRSRGPRPGRAALVIYTRKEATP